MAFSWGAAAGGAAQTLEQILTERRQAALLAQQQAQKAAEQEFQERELAQRLQIAKMADEREDRRAQAAAQNARMTQAVTELGGASDTAVAMTRPGDEVNAASQADILRLAREVAAGGRTPLVKAGLEFGETLPFSSIVPEMPMTAPAPEMTPMAQALRGGSAPGATGEAVPMPTDTPGDTSTPTLAGLRRIEGPMAPQVFRRFTAAEREDADTAAAVAAYYDDITKAQALRDPGAQSEALLKINTRLALAKPKVREAVTNVISPLLSESKEEQRDIRRTAAENARDARFREQLAATQDRQEASAIMRLYDDYRADKRIQGAEAAETAKTITAAVDTGTVTPFDRLSLMYAFIRIADNYQTGVRNEEIKMMAMPMSDVSKLKTRVEAIVNENKIIDDKTMKDITSATKRLIAPVEAQAQRRRTEFIRAADAVGIGKKFVTIIGTGAGAREDDALLDELLKK